MNNIKHKTVLVVGGANGGGRSFVEFAAAQGAKHIVIWDLDETGMQHLVQQTARTDCQLHTFRVDVNNPHFVEAALEYVFGKVGGVDVLVNNVRPSTEFLNCKGLGKKMSSALVAPMNITRAVIDNMAHLQQASIINIVSGRNTSCPHADDNYCHSLCPLQLWSQELSAEMQQSLPHIKVQTLLKFHFDASLEKSAIRTFWHQLSAQIKAVSVNPARV
ncbi:SDR family NAD(P)-dependent oxidoreductase [Motilimonas pumila]|uniref:SDR family NAD(P)-dependent oxidoreductase n=1 Tax=Motilimonas pumila TaxID=2303987 RepID=A0A418YGP7_9GAMM|nr:SDR family NAD(P)-dependent oxidoreductase [Motilimonas pumila]RJG48683.1 SDR family NAD(P)-dependent oxidoreductase [Motilimonas pumila]